MTRRPRTTSTVRRETTLDLTRFCCAMAVLAYHHLFYGPTTRHRSAPYLFAPAVTRYGFLGVPVFFVISGYVILNTFERRSSGSFLRARAARLYPAWVVIVGLLGV